MTGEIFNRPIKRSGNHRTAFSLLSNTQTDPLPPISTGSGPFHREVRGSFHSTWRIGQWTVDARNDQLQTYQLSRAREFNRNRAWRRTFFGAPTEGQKVCVKFLKHVFKCLMGLLNCALSLGVIRNSSDVLNLELFTEVLNIFASISRAVIRFND